MNPKNEEKHDDSFKPASVVFKMPGQFGLRGDPVLWRELEKTYEEEFASWDGSFEAFLVHNFEFLTGQPLLKEARYFVSRFNEGGMSGGMVFCDFWIEKGIPLLLAQFEGGARSVDL